jgi:carbon-monoxide dehydrogenase large subunit
MFDMRFLHGSKTTGTPVCVIAQVVGRKPSIPEMLFPQTIGQGHGTSFPQITSDLLGVPDRAVRLVDGDTDRIPTGGGHGSSRSTYMAGTSMWRVEASLSQRASSRARRLAWPPLLHCRFFR